MRNVRKTTFIVSLVSLLLLILPAFAAADGFQHATAVCSDLSNKSSDDTLVVRIQFSADPTASPKDQVTEETLARLSRSFKRRGEMWFSVQVDGLDLRLEVGVRGTYDLPDDSAHQVRIVKGPYRSHGDIFYSSVPLGSQQTGIWDVRSLTYTETRYGLHEVMHFAALADGYGYYYRSPTGARVEAPAGMYTNDPVSGAIENPDDWAEWATRQGIDIKQLRLTAEAKPGHENDLMANHFNATRLLPADVAFLKSNARRCKRDVLSDVESPRACYTAPDSLRIFGLPKFVPYSRIEDRDSAISRYPTAAGKPFKVRMSCSFGAEANGIRGLMDSAISAQLDAKKKQIELDSSNPDITPPEVRHYYQKLINQGLLNAAALAHEAIYRNSISHVLIAHDRSGYGTVAAAKVRKLETELAEFNRTFSDA